MPPAREPAISPWLPMPTGCTPDALPSWPRTLSAISRSMPGRSARPATRPSMPGARGAASRSSTCSTTCTAAVRPNRASSARGNGSALSIVPVASPSVRCPPDTFDKVSVNVSSPSSCASSSTATVIVRDDSPVWNVSVPLAGRVVRRPPARCRPTWRSPPSTRGSPRD